MKQQRVPKKALSLSSPDATIKFFRDDNGGAVAERLDMVAYSGNVINDHFWWGNLAIDLDGIVFEREKYPILEGHWVESRIAFTGVPIIDDSGLRINPDTTVFLDTDESKRFRNQAAAGFPFQSSIYAIPTKVEEIPLGETTEVNGYSLAGPATVWRNCIFQEASVCVFGWDRKTHSSVMSNDGDEVELNYEVLEGTMAGKQSGDSRMTFQEAIQDPAVVEAVKDAIKPEIEAEVKDAIKEEVKEEVKAEIAAENDGAAPMADGEGGGDEPPKEEDKQWTLEEARDLIQKILAEYPELASEVGQKEGTDQMAKKQIAELEKKLARIELQNAAQQSRAAGDLASSIITGALSSAGMPAKYASKLHRIVPHADFMKDGLLDQTKFSNAVKKEVDDLASIVGDRVLGGAGFSKRVDSGSDKSEATRVLEQENDEVAERMFSIVSGKKARA